MNSIALKKTIISIILILIVTLILIFFVQKNNSTSSIYSVSNSNIFFDTFVSITIYDDNKSNKNINQELILDCFEKCSYFEKIFSTTRSDSELFIINHSSDYDVRMSDSLSELISQSIYYNELSEGAFNFTLGTLCNLWNFKNKTVPSQKDITEGLSIIKSFEIKNNENILSFILNQNINENADKNYFENNNSINFQPGKPQIDLGGIAKGYIADKLKDYLTQKGVKSAIINLGGNVLLVGDKYGKNFTIGINYPFSESGEEIAVVELSDKSIVTSGVYERYFQKDGKLYHHILDPETGYPVENNLYSVTIIANSSTTADALSTAVFVMGMDEGLEFINALEEVYAVFVTSENELILSNGLSLSENNIISIID